MKDTTRRKFFGHAYNKKKLQMGPHIAKWTVRAAIIIRFKK